MIGGFRPDKARAKREQAEELYSFVLVDRKGFIDAPKCHRQCFTTISNEWQLDKPCEHEAGRREPVNGDRKIGNAILGQIEIALRSAKCTCAKFDFDAPLGCRLDLFAPFLSYNVYVVSRWQPLVVSKRGLSCG